MSNQTTQRLDDDINRLLTARDVTADLLADTSGPGEYVALVRRAAPAKSITPTLRAVLDKLSATDDRTGGAVSNFLAYGGIMRRGGKAWHRDLVRLMRSGHVRVTKVAAPPPPGSNAHREAPYGLTHYIVEPTATAAIDP
jgi:hypothetical protein